MAGGGKNEDLDLDRSKSLFGRHMVALLKKRLLTFKRDKKMWAFVVLMPALFVLFGILILTSVSSYSEPAILLTPAVSAVQRIARAGLPDVLVWVPNFLFSLCVWGGKDSTFVSTHFRVAPGLASQQVQQSASAVCVKKLVSRYVCDNTLLLFSWHGRNCQSVVAYRPPGRQPPTKCEQ